MLSTIVRVDVLGGANIGKSSALVEAVDRNGHRRYIMIDCGAGFAHDDSNFPMPLRPRMQPDLIAVTHAHTDHSLLAPKYFADYNCKFLMTGPTYFTDEFLFKDHLRVSEIRGVKPVFSREEMVSFFLSDKTEIVYHSDWIEIFPGIEMRFHHNGHIRGSACVLLRTDGRKMMFSGDMSKNDMPTVKGIVPPGDFQPDVLFLESTNGCSGLPDREAEVRRLLKVAGKFRFALIPAFGVGRSPDLVLDLVRYGFPTFLDGMGRKIIKAYYGDEKFSWSENDVEIPEELMRRIKFIKNKAHRNEIAGAFSAKAVVTTGGMMNGPALAYAVDYGWLEMPDAAVLDVGYVAPGTPGKKLLESVEGGMPFETERGKFIKVEAHVERFALSAHISGPQNVELVKELKPGKIFLGHGEKESRQGLSEWLQKEGFDARPLQEGQAIELE